MLENEYGFSTIFHTWMGKAASYMMEAIFEQYQNAPPLCVLMLSQEYGLPGKGAISVREQMDKYKDLVDWRMGWEDWRCVTVLAPEDVYSRPARYNEVFEGSFRRTSL